jgi:hypothetical protein
MPGLLLLALLVAAPAWAGHSAAGTKFLNPGGYHTLNGSEVGGSWIVQPGGLAPMGSEHEWNFNFLFLTVVNDKRGSPEFLNIYDRWGKGAIGLHAWSCEFDPAHPCPLPEGDPRGASSSRNVFIFVVHMEDNPQYLYDLVDDGGHPNQAIAFILRTEELGNVRPGQMALWRVRAMLFDQQTGSWDVVWQHEYPYPKVDCGDPVQSPCGHEDWAGTLEANPDPAHCREQDQPCSYSRIREIGVHRLYIRHDRGTSLLAPPQTIFYEPDRGTRGMLTPWRVEHRIGNHSFGIGNWFPPTR